MAHMINPKIGYSHLMTTKLRFKTWAFFLLTHNFDAKPMDDYVELNLNGAIYKLTPNCDMPGLCDISPAISLL